MASSAKQVCRQARQLSSHRTQWLSLRQTPVSRLTQERTFTSTTVRTFTSTSLRSAEDEPKKDEESGAPYFSPQFYQQLDADDKSAYKTFTPAQRQQMEKVDEALRDEFADGSRTHRELEEAIRASMLDIEERFPEELDEREPRNDGFFQMGEKEDIGPDDEFAGDDISSTAHAELEQTREIREYARNAAWEMPLLANLAKPFQPPTTATPLRFRYTTYLGEAHPAAKKVVVEFDPQDLTPLNAAQKTTLIKLLGPRYNPTTGIAKLSSESFETQAQNKRYLGDTIASLIATAKDPSADSFADLPLDFRHQKPKPRLQFPERWLLTEERKAELEARRQARLAEEEAKKELPQGLVDGVREIEDARKIADLARVEAPIMAEAKAPLAKGKMGKARMGQIPGR